MALEIARPPGDADRPPAGSLLIDCDSCQVRGDACADCVVTCLLGGPPDPLRLDGDEVDALGALAGLGMVPPLRLVTAVRTREPALEQPPADSS